MDYFIPGKNEDPLRSAEIFVIGVPYGESVTHGLQVLSDVFGYAGFAEDVSRHSLDGIAEKTGGFDGLVQPHPEFDDVDDDLGQGGKNPRSSR